MFKSEMLIDAKLDVKEAANWYNLRQKGLGKRFTSEVVQKVRQLEKEPYSAPIRFDHVKTAVLDVFPFMIHYIVNDTRKVLIILAVLHTSRNPDIWKAEADTDYSL